MNNQITKGSSLFVATILVGAGINSLPINPWFGLACLISGGALFFVREYFLKK